MIAYDIITPKGDYSLVYISPYREVTILAIFQHTPDIICSYTEEMSYSGDTVTLLMFTLFFFSLGYNVNDPLFS